MRTLPAVVAALLSFTTLDAGAQRAEPAPDIVLVNGKVFTSDSSRPWAEAVAIRGNRIVAVGSTRDIRARAARRSRVVDVGGRVVVPGFNDAHDHVSGGTPGISVADDVPAAQRSVSSLLDSLRAASGRTPAGTWLRAALWPAALGDSVLRRPALDRAAPDHPVILGMGTGHGYVLNTAALRALGIGESEPDPFGGWYERDASGKLTGRLDEYAGWRALRTLRSSLPDSALVSNLQAYARRELRFGITSVQDMASNMDPATTIRVLAKAQLPLRMHVVKFPIPDPITLRTDEWAGIAHRPSPNLIVSGVKWILDGTPVEQNALERRAYAGRTAWYGRLNFPMDSVREMLARALRTHEQIALHAGDSTQVLLLGLMESLAPDSAWRPLRVRFEHGIRSPDLWPRAAAKGIVAVANLQLLPPPEISRRMPRLPLAAVIPRGLTLALGSDGEPRSPFVGMYYALSFPTEPRIPREMLVRAYTAGSAYAEFEERDKGVLAVGMLADLAVLSQDIFTVQAEELPTTESVLTLVGGRVAYDAGVLGRRSGH